MARRPRPTLADYAVIGISPALIMFLIGSLVFFLITILYQGQFDVRLSFIMAMFIMAAVSIARISIEQGREYASLFAVPLAGVTLYAMFQFVEFGGAFARLSSIFNVALIAIIWFLADKLTWDCTVIDENQDQSGQGLLQTAGMDDEQPEVATEAASDDPGEPPPPVATGLWQKFVEHRRRPHAPGIWVIYFSIAALPIFGFGQMFLRDSVSRRYAFKLLVIFVASALGLLLTTSFLGLRRYLRQRRLEMPPEMAGTWLGVGAVMIVALLLVCMLMPRRNAEYSISDLAFLNSPIDLPVSDWAVGNDGQQQDDAERTIKQDDAAQQMDGQQGEGGHNESAQGKSGGNSQQTKGQPGGEKSGSQGSGQKEPQGKQQSGDGSQNKSPDPSSSSQPQQRQPSQQQGKQGNQGDRPPETQGDQTSQSQQSPDKQRQNESQDGNQQDQDPADPAGDSPDSDDGTQPRQQEDARQDASSDSQSQSQSKTSRQSRSNQQNAAPPAKPRPNPSQLLRNLSPTLGGIFKALYWLIAIAVVGYFLWKHWEQVRHAMQNFIQALRDLWERLFGGRAVDAEAEAASAAKEAAPTWRPFSDFADPFSAGRADRMSTEELIGYTFEAFEAWGRENGCQRLAEQTPIEFAKAAIRSHDRLGKQALRVAELYNWTAFGKTAVPAANREHLRRFWQALSSGAVA